MRVFSLAVKITFHFNSEAHAEAHAEIRNKRQTGRKNMGGQRDRESLEETEGRQERGTRDKQTEGGMWRQSHGWIKKVLKKFQREIKIVREQRGEEEETYGFDYKAMMSCMYVR